VNFLKLLRAGHSDFVINMDAITYMQANKLQQTVFDAISRNLGMVIANEAQWSDF
jgi:hypothetical protein